MPNVNVSDLEINYTAEKLVAGTYGRGLWNIIIDNATLGVDEIATTGDDTPQIFPNPVTDGYLNVVLNGQNGPFNYMMYNVVGGVVKKEC
ncbi:MAG: hypothetical protein R2783_01405 [Gelidibacter sp.]